MHTIMHHMLLAMLIVYFLLGMVAIFCGLFKR